MNLLSDPVAINSCVVGVEVRPLYPNGFQAPEDMLNNSFRHCFLQP